MPLPPPVTTAVTWETSKILRLSSAVLSALPFIMLSGKMMIWLLQNLDRMLKSSPQNNVSSTWWFSKHGVGVDSHYLKLSGTRAWF